MNRALFRAIYVGDGGVSPREPAFSAWQENAGNESAHLGMSGLEQAALAALLMFSMTVIGSVMVAAALGGSQRLPLVFRSDSPPQRGLVGATQVVIGAVIGLGAQLADLALGLAPGSIFEPVGSWVLKIEPIFAILWTWYLHSRYRQE